MHTLELNGKKLVIAKMSESAHRYFLPLIHTSKYGQSLETEWNGVYYPLPEGSWRLHSTWPEMTETEAAELLPIESIKKFYPNYDYKVYTNKAGHEIEGLYGFPKALQSFRSLLESLSLPLTARYAILTEA